MSALRGTSLEKARQWQEWADWNLAPSPLPGWARFLHDALRRDQAFKLTASRRLRGGNPVWDRQGGGEEDWMALTHQAEALQGWWLANKPSELERARPEYRKMAEAIEGSLAQNVRLARELDDVKASHGIMPVNVNPHAAGDQFAEH